MKPIRFAHLADLHLDTPFKGLGDVHPDLARKLQDASLKAWDTAVDTCIEEQVDFAVIAGDVYDTTEAGVRAQLRFLKGVRELVGAGVHVFIVHGNHDPRGGKWPAIDEWPDGVTIFGHDDVRVVPVERDGDVIALVHGISYAEQHVTENLALRYKRDWREVFQVGLLHCSVGDDPNHGRYAPCSLSDLEGIGLDYWALGHIHSRRILRDAAPTVAYAGNLQARHPNEQGAKGILLVEVTPNEQQPKVEFRPCDAWRFDQVDVDLAQAGLTTVPELQDRLLDGALELSDEHAGCGLILRAHVHGASSLHDALRRSGTAENLLEALRDNANADLWWDDVRLETRAELDREARLATGDFLSDLLQRSDTEAPTAGDTVDGLLQELERNTAFRAVRSSLDLESIASDAEDLWAEAERLAFDRLDELDGAEG